MTKINTILLFFEKVVGTLLFGIMFTIISLNIVFRYLLDKPIYWAVEMANFLFVLMAFLSCAYSVGRNGHIRVTLLINLIGEKSKIIIEILTNLILIILFSSLVVPCWNVLNTLTLSAALKIPEKYVYIIIPLTFLLSAFHVGINIYLIISRSKNNLKGANK